MGLLDKVVGFVGDVFDFAFGWIYPEMPDTSSSVGTEITAASTDAFIPKIYGKVVDAKGIIVFKRTNDVDDDDIKNDLLHIIVVWAEAVQSIDEVYLNDVPVSADYMPMVDEDGNRWVYAINFPNGMDNYSDPILEQAGWSATDKLSGLACTYIRLEYNTVDDSLTSEPRISADITGTSYTNPALVLKDYLTSSVYGKGLSTSVLDLDAFTAAEQVCDQDVFLPDNVTQRKLFTCNVRIDTGNTVLDNTNIILRSMRAMMPIVDGKLRPIVEKDEVPVSHAIVEQDIEELGGITNSNKNNRYNRVIVKYYDVENRGKAQEAIYPLPDSQEATDWLAEDNGVLLETDVDLGTCNNYYEALEFAKSYARVSREQLSTRIVLNKWGTIYEVGDIVEVTHSFPAWDAKPFRITAIQENTDTVELSLREHQPYIYDFYNTGDKPEIVDTGLDLAAPAVPTNLTVTHVYDSFKQVTVAWTGGTTRYDYQVLSSTGTVLTNGRIARKTVDLQGYALGTYTFKVRAVGGVGKVSGWSQIDVIMQLPSTPTSLTINASNFDIEVIPQLIDNDGATQFEFSITDSVETSPQEVRGAASAYTFTGLTHDTTYKVWVRSVNLLGSSDWVSQLVTTTADVNYIGDLIDLDNITSSIDKVSFELTNLGISFSELNNSVEDVELEFLRGLTQQSASREDLRLRVENDEKLIDAAVYVDPTTGTIINRAFSYSDDLFTSASLRIDGVEGSIDLVSQSVSLVEGEIENLSAELTLVPSQITATATTIVAEAISALEPAHTFNFFDSAQGWVAVNGTLSTALPNEISVTYGDIENSSLDFDAADNTFIRLTIERTGGTGWTGNVIIERDDSSTQTFTGIIDDVVSGGEVVRTIDLRGVTGWDGTVNRVRLVLGASTSDTFTIKSIVIGKPDATVLELEDITARISQAEVDINSNTGEINLVATNLQTFEDDTADNFTIVSSKIDSVDSKIENRVFSINADRRDFEAQALEELRGLIDESGYRQLDIDEKVSYADAINQLNVDISDRGALAQSITALESTTVTLDTQIQTVATDLLQTESTLESAIAQSATTLQAQIDTNDSEISALVSDVSQAQTDISGNASAISQLQTRVTDGETFAAAQLLLNSDYEAELGTLSARAFLGTNVNDQVTGITIADSGAEQTIEFISDSVKFLDSDGNVKIYYDTSTGSYLFDGDILARSLQGKVVTGDNIVANSISTANLTVGIDFSNLSKNGLLQTGNFDGWYELDYSALTTNRYVSETILASSIGSYQVGYGVRFTDYAGIDVMSVVVAKTATTLSLDHQFINYLGNLTNVLTVSDMNTFNVSLGSYIEVIAKGSNSYGAVLSAPEAFMISMRDGYYQDPNTLAESTLRSRILALKDVPLETSDDILVEFKVASGGSTRLFDGVVRFVFADADDSETVVLVPFDTTLTSWKSYSETVSVPSGSVKVKNVEVRRHFDGRGFGFFSSLKIRQKLGGGLLTADAIDGKKISGAKIVGGTFQSIGTNTMIVTSGTPFGVDNLLEWRGSTVGNVENGEAILGNLTKVNAVSWLDDNNNQYTSGTIIAGTLTVSKQTPEVSTTPSIETGLFGSNGGQIAINCSYFGSARDFSGGTCPTHPNPTITMRLYRLSPSGTVLVNQQSFTGEYSCLQEGAEYLATWALNGTFTFYDNLNTTSDRNYRLEATVSNLIGNPDVNQRLSILTQEA